MASDANERIYEYFLSSAVESGHVYTLRCCGDDVAVQGPAGLAMPLWPTEADLEFYRGWLWPTTTAQCLDLDELLLRLALLDEEGVPAAIGLAPFPDAVVVLPDRLSDDLELRMWLG